jgi:signal peptidase I
MATPGTSDQTGGRLAHLKVWQETLLLLVIALALALGTKAFFLQAFYIPSPSMKPGFVQNDRRRRAGAMSWSSTTRGTG